MAKVWKIAPGEVANGWEMCRQQGCIALGWAQLTDYRKFKSEGDVLAALGGGKGDGKGAARSIWRFVHVIQPSDVVIANKGKSRVVGIGLVTSDYLPPSPENPSQNKNLPHARRVDWLIDQPIDLEPEFFGIATIHALTAEKVGQIKQAYLKKYPDRKDTLDQLFPPPPPAEGPMKALLEQLGQVILYGPPGTGKTREAKRVALALLQRELTGLPDWFLPCPKCKSPMPHLSEDTSGRKVDCPKCKSPMPYPILADAMTDEQVDEALTGYQKVHRFDLVVFHPAYEYEQFVGGIEPIVTENHLGFQVKAGVFLRLCRQAEPRPDLPRPPSVVLVIDEINRGNLPKLLGELVYALKYRDRPVTLPFAWEGRADLVVPKNLYVIATMNSADRSIGHIDVAIRRRFGLYPLGARPEVVQQVWSAAGDEPYGVRLAALLKRLNEKLGSGHDPSAAVELGVGHSYFLPAPGSSGETAKEQVQMKWAYQVQPLLREYAQLLNLSADSLQEFFKPLDQCLAQP
jgi:5-methylcytosine-specific restriction enzyme B